MERSSADAGAPYARAAASARAAALGTRMRMVFLPGGRAAPGGLKAAVAREERLDLRGRHRRAEEESLHLVAAPRGEERELRIGLDAFGEHLEVEAVGERDDRFRDREASRVGRDLPHEREVDLQAVDREALEVA